MSAPAVHEWRTSAALVQAQLLATLARLEQGTGTASVRLFATPRPEVLGTLPEEYLADIPLASPAGAVDASVLVLHPSSPAGAMVLQTGVPRWGVLIAADGAVLAEGGVTAEGGGGCFEVGGGTVADGEAAPTFYAGGLLTLTGTALT